MHYEIVSINPTVLVTVSVFSKQPCLFFNGDWILETVISMISGILHVQLLHILAYAQTHPFQQWFDMDSHRMSLLKTKTYGRNRLTFSHWRMHSTMHSNFKRPLVTKGVLHILLCYCLFQCHCMHSSNSCWNLNPSTQLSMKPLEMVQYFKTLTVRQIWTPVYCYPSSKSQMKH